MFVKRPFRQTLYDRKNLLTYFGSPCYLKLSKTKIGSTRANIVSRMHICELAIATDREQTICVNKQNWNVLRALILLYIGLDPYKIDDYAKDGGAGVVCLFCRFYHGPLRTLIVKEV